MGARARPLRAKEPGLLQPQLCRLSDLLLGTSLPCSFLGVMMVQVLVGLLRCQDSL